MTTTLEIDAETKAALEFTYGGETKGILELFAKDPEEAITTMMAEANEFCGGTEEALTREGVRKALTILSEES